jgi:hypothetical protein
MFLGPGGATIGAIAGGIVGGLVGTGVGEVTRKPDIVLKEEQAWSEDHSLQISFEYQRRNLPLIENFGPELHLCYRWCEMAGIKYCHYFVTDSTWTIEFGAGELSSCTCEIHNNRLPGDHRIQRTFANDDEVQARMRQVVGATGYSLCLRNCEHVARYIYCGSWTCTQMVPNGHLHKQFISYLMADAKRYMNTMPLQLEPPEGDPNVLYEGQTGIIKFDRKKQALDVYDQKKYNVVVMGPTGSLTNAFPKRGPTP